MQQKESKTKDNVVKQRYRMDGNVMALHDVYLCIH